MPQLQLLGILLLMWSVPVATYTVLFFPELAEAVKHAIKIRREAKLQHAGHWTPHASRHA